MEPEQSARRRWPRRLAVVLAIFVIVLAASVTIAPRYVARYLLASELDALGIAYEGLDTLELDLWRGRTAIGPLSLIVDQAAPARLARFEAVLDLAALLAGRIAIEKVSFQGIELDVSRSVDGEVAMNGMQVDTLPGAGLAPGLLHGEILEMEVGLESVEVADSHLSIQTPWGGQLDLALERLALTGFRGWQPEQPTRFHLDARVNDMPMRWSGEVTPLLEEPGLRLDASIDDVTLERVARLAKPWKLARAKGRYSIQSSHELSLARSGELSGHSEGTLTLTGADYRLEGLIEASGNRMEAGFETSYRLPEAGGWQLSGRADLSLDQVTVSGPEQARLGFRALRFSLNDVQSSRDAAGNGHLQLASELQADDATLRGRLRLSVEMIIVLLRALQFLAAGPDAPTSTSGLDSWAGHEAKLPAIDLAVARLRSKVERFEITTSEKGVSLTLDSVSEATRIRAAAENQTTDAETLRLAIPKLRLSITPEGASLEAVLSAQVSSVKGVREVGEATFEAIEAAIESGEINVIPGSVSGRLSGRAGITQLRSTVKGKPGLPAASFDLAAGLATLGQASLTATTDSGSWKIDGGLQASGMVFEVGKPKVARGAVGRIDVTGIKLRETRSIVADSIHLRGVDVAVLGSYLDRELLSDTRPVEDITEPQLGRMPETVAEAPDRAPTPDEAPPVSLDRVQRALAERGFDPGPVDGTIGRRTAAAIKAFQNERGLAADGRVSHTLLEALGLGRPAVSGPVRARAETKPSIQYRIGRLELAKGAKFHYSDDTVEPDVDVAAVFDTLSLRNLDTGDPDQRLELRASAKVNELSRMEISGWLAPLRDPPDLDLKLVVEDLELSPFASYTDRYLGLSVDEGQLSTVSEVAVQQGALDARLELDIRRLQVRPLTEEDEKQLADTLGVSVTTALRLVKDAEGRIELSIPISGTVDEPEIDPSDAVNKAIGSVVASLLPTSWIAKLFSGGDDDVDFEPVVFDAGSNELTETGRQYLDQLAAAMRQHPNAVLTVCGRTAAADAQTLRSRGMADDQLASWGGALAVQRTRAVRLYLVQEQGLPAKRVTECRAAYSESDPQPPRVEISL
jgi:outer membrane protein OmpA-like peptidoglycan-associated protein